MSGVERPSRVTDLRLWLVALGGMVLWGVHFFGFYLGAEVVCKTDFLGGELGNATVAGVVLLAAGTLMALLALTLALLAWRALRRLPDDDEPALFMSRFGVLANGFFALVILAQSLPLLWFGVCG